MELQIPPNIKELRTGIAIKRIKWDGTLPLQILPNPFITPFPCLLEYFTFGDKPQKGIDLRKKVLTDISAYIHDKPKFVTSSDITRLVIL